jgi:hypothetical protein
VSSELAAPHRPSSTPARKCGFVERPRVPGPSGFAKSTPASHALRSNLVEEGPWARSPGSHWVEQEFEGNIVTPIEDFQDPSQEWRRLLSEVLGTFFLVLVAAGGGMMNQAFDGAIGRAAAVTAPGLALAVAAAFVLRGRGGGEAGSGAAQGDLFTEAARPDQA